MGENAFYWSVVMYDAVIMFIFGCLYLVERKKYILSWTLSWFFYTLSILFFFLKSATPYAAMFNSLDNIAGLLSIVAISKGSVEFFTEKNYKAISSGSLIFILYYILIGFLHLPDTYFVVPRMVFSGVLLIYTGVISVQVVYIRSAIRYILSACFFIWGGSSLYYLLGYALGPAVFFSSFQIIGLAAIGTTIVIQTIYFQKGRETQSSLDKKMQYLIKYDALTDIYNRGYCEMEMEKVDKEDQLPISIILGDLNGLKLINDTFGHKKGDQVLSSMANILKGEVSGHILGRWGGDEFIVMLTKTPSDKAIEIMESIKTRCREYKDDIVPLDISLGTSTKEESMQSLADIIEKADNMLYKNKLIESRTFRKSIADYLKNMLLDKNIETEEHVLRMRDLAYLVAGKMGLSPKEREDLAMAAFLHDIGKISVPDHILKKPEKLTGEEWEIMKKHSETGYKITLSYDDFVHISQSVLAHHERWDGNGYPLGLKEQDIPLAARIISVIDAYDAMTNTRVYKEAISTEEALAEIERCSGTQFDPDVAKLFIQTVRETISGDILP